MNFHDINGMSLFFLLIIISGVVMVFIGLKIFCFYAITIKKWGKVEGLILNSEAMCFSSGTDNEWKIEIEYSFVVDELKYISKTTTKNIPITCSSKSTVIGHNVFYEKGQTVTVYYNKKKPKQSVIDKEFGLGSFLIVLTGIISICVGYVNLDFNS